MKRNKRNDFDAAGKTKQNIGGGVFSAARARDQLIRDLGPVVYSKPDRPVKASQRAGAKADQERASVSLRPAPDRPKKRQDDLRPEKSAVDLRRDKDGTCKARPDSSRGSGSGRKFVPWCTRRG